MRGKELLTPEQRLNYFKIPLTNWELARYYTFSKEEIELIMHQRKEQNRLGFAVQLALLKYPGWGLTPNQTLEPKFINYIASQLFINPVTFYSYPQRENTLWEHMKKAKEYSCIQDFTTNRYKKTLKFCIYLALENESTIELIQSVIDKLRLQKIHLPSLITIERIVWEAKYQADRKIYRQMNQFLSIKQKLKLNHMLKVVDRNELSELNWLKLSVSNYSPESFLKVIERLEYIRSFQLDFDLSFIHPTRLKQLARLGSKYEPRSLQRFSDDKRYTLLVAYLSVSSGELIDQAFDIHNRQMNTLEAKGRKRRLEFQRTNGKALNEKIVHYSILGDTLIEAKQKEIDVFTLLEKLIPWDNFVESVEEAKQLSRPLDNDYLDLLASRFSYLRKYTPTLLNSLAFKSTAATEPLIEALSVIRDMNDSGKRKIPEHAPLNFTTKRWAKYISNKDGTINRQYYELAAFTELRNRIRGGDVSIMGSKKYEEFDFYLISKEEWASILESDTKLAVPFDAEAYLSERISSLNVRLEWLNDNIDTLDDVTIEEGHLHVSKLEKEVPEGAEQFSSKLYSMLPRIKLTDLLLEVANWTDFDKHFLHASTGKEPKIEDRDYILGTLMAMGTNIGLTKMAAATPGISYYEMANIAQWRMYDDAMDKAQTQLVNFQHAQSLSSIWGDGHSSSSDGMRVQIGVPSGLSII